MMRKIIENSCGHSLKNKKIIQYNELSCAVRSQEKLIIRPSPGKIQNESLTFLEHIQDDIYGPIYPPCESFRYFMIIIDASIVWSHVCSQLDIFEIICSIDLIKKIHLDNVSEFTS